ncbi:SDR family NAD(P)-dependent oxidoreductase [Streptomyces tendae]|uniref:SDR family NAD(P)-dependent oxidoreductase n=1 Tax=Streptomyces tendae TaxID=1932 RepID=A0ABW7S9B1_STRTE
MAVDIGDELSVQRAVTHVAATFGRLDFAVNNAGIPTTGHILTEILVHEWERVLRVNLTGTWLCLKYQLPVMKQHGGGAIVNVASNGGLYAIPGAPAYMASKHGVVGLPKVAAVDYGPDNISVAVLAGRLLHHRHGAVRRRRPTGLRGERTVVGRPMPPPLPCDHPRSARHRGLRPSPAPRRVGLGSTYVAGQGDRRAVLLHRGVVNCVPFRQRGACGG